jgi:hypothetical protein
VLVAVLLVGAVATPLAFAQSSTSSDRSNYGYSELRDNGKVVDDRYPSLRVAGEMTAFWFVRYPPSGLGGYGDRTQQEYIEPSTTVERNRIRLYATHPFDGGNRSYTVTKVYWRPESRQEKLDNGTVVERTVANVTAVDQQEVTFQSGMRRHADVGLRGYYEDSTRVTVFLEGEGIDEQQWTFKHQSTETATPVNIGSKGDLLKWSILWILLPSLVVAWVADSRVSSFRRKARAGPGYGVGVWIALGVIGIAALYWLAWSQLASLTAQLPLVLPLLVGWVVAARRLEDDDEEKDEWGFIRLDPSSATSPLDDKAEVLDSGEIEIEGRDVIRTEDGTPALYNSGIMSMWARAKDCYATIDLRNAEAEWSGVGDYDRVVVVDQDVDELIHEKPERVVWAWPWKTYTPPRDEDGEVVEEEYDPELDEVLPDELGRDAYIRTAGIAAAPFAAAWATASTLGAWFVGPLLLLPAAFIYAEPIDGVAWTDVAPGQARKAWTTAWYLDLNVRRFGTIDEVLEALVEAENRERFDVSKWLDEAREEGLIDRAHDAQSEPFDTALSQDDPALGSSEDVSTAGGTDDD